MITTNQLVFNDIDGTVPCKRKVVKNHVFSTYLINNVEYITILYENPLFFL